MKVDRLLRYSLFSPALAGAILTSALAIAGDGQIAADRPRSVLRVTNDNFVFEFETGQEPDLKTLSGRYENAAQRCMAGRLYQDALKFSLLHYDACKRLFGESDPQSGRALNQVGQVYYAQGHYLQASSYFRRALKICSANGDSHEMAVALNNLGAAGVHLGDYSGAQKSFDRAAAFYESQVPVDPAFGILLINFAQLQESLGNLHDATAIATRAVSLLQKGAPSPGLAMGLTLMGRFRLLRRDFGGAEAALARSLQCLHQIGEEESVVGASAIRHLAKLYAETDRRREAEPLFQRAIRIDERFQNTDMLPAMKDYAIFLRRTKRKREAKKLEANLRARADEFSHDNPSGQLVDVSTLLREQRR